MVAIFPAIALGLQLPSPPLPSAAFTSSMAAYRDAASACAAVAREPASGEAWRCLGRLLHGKGRLEAARTALTRATELAPTDAASQIALANVLRSIGRFDEAVTALAAAESLTGKRDQSLCYFRTPGTAAAATPAPEAAVLRGGASRQVRALLWAGVRVRVRVRDRVRLERRLALRLSRKALARIFARTPRPHPKQVRVSPIASREECEWVIATAEACSCGNRTLPLPLLLTLTRYYALESFYPYPHSYPTPTPNPNPD